MIFLAKYFEYWNNISIFALVFYQRYVLIKIINIQSVKIEYFCLISIFGDAHDL